MKSILAIMFLALLGGQAAMAAPSNTTIDDTVTTPDTPLEHDCACIASETCEVSMRIEGRVDVVLECASADGWCSLEREDGKRIQWASLEGDADDMQQLADAVESRRPMMCSRLALAWHDSGDGLLWSPRNSLVMTRVDAQRLDELVPKIRAVAERA